MNKTFKRILSSLLLLLVLPLSMQAMAAETEETEEVREIKQLSISSMADFEAFREACVRDVYSRDLVVTLKTDLDFTGQAFEAIPSFSGTFEGNRHTIRGISLKTEGSAQGLFRYLTDTAVVRDLTVLGDILPTGSKSMAGGIAGSNSGLIKNCKFKGIAAGTEFIGGIAGVNETGGIIEDCMVSGAVRGTHFAGGIAGTNYGVIRGCKNLASINVREQDNKVDSISFDPDFLMGKEALETATDLGGIAGTSSGVIRDCANHGNVGYPRMGYNLGGIAGSQKGFIVECRNQGTIQGRKEIAGIAGQMEPIVEISFEEDTLQILRRQLNNTSSLANRASGNIRTGSQDLKGDIENLHGSAQTAIDAIEELIPSEGEWPDGDTLIAANNSLRGSISTMQNSLIRINESAQSMVGTAAADIRAINNSIADISRTLDNAAETLGGSITDISDLDTEDNLSGKIQDCHNAGFISGDLNVGGITGAIAWENDKDPEDDFTVSGDRSLNFDPRLRAVILRCSNTAKIQANKRCAGGIAGNMCMGLAKDCLNTGFIEGENADYIGGIAGTSLGYLRNNSVKCKLLGNSWIGGIAGSASIVSDCRSTVMIEDGKEQLGSVLGAAEEDRTDSEQPIHGNYYLPLADHLGAIDGIDYYEQADSLKKADFLSLPDLSSVFFRASMTFQYPDGSTQKLVVPLGDVVPESKIPAPPRKEGYLARWDMLDDLDLAHMFFDVTLEAEYERANTVVESDLKRWDGKPVLLAEGSFGAQKTVEISPWTQVPPDRSILECWSLPEIDTDRSTVIHLTIPEGMDPESGSVLLMRGDGAWEETDVQLDGTYLTFTVQPGDQAAAVYESHGKEIAELLTVSGILLLIVVVILFIVIRKKKKRKKSKKA